MLSEIKRFNFKSRILLGLGIGVLLFLTISIFYFWKNQRIFEVPTSTPTPQSGADIYLEGKLPAIFTVLNMDAEAKSMELEFTTTADLYGKVIKSVIDCKPEESFITYTFGPPGSDDTKQAEKPLYEYQELLSSEKPVMLWAYCANRECNSLVKKCELKIQK